MTKNLSESLKEAIEQENLIRIDTILANNPGESCYLSQEVNNKMPEYDVMDMGHGQYDGHNALETAVSMKKLSVVKHLLKKESTELGRALHIACANAGGKDMVEEILKIKYFDINKRYNVLSRVSTHLSRYDHVVKIKEGMTPFLWALRDISAEEEKGKDDSWLKAEEQNKKDIRLMLLKDSRTDINSLNRESIIGSSWDFGTFLSENKDADFIKKMLFDPRFILHKEYLNDALKADLNNKRFDGNSVLKMLMLSPKFNPNIQYTLTSFEDQSGNPVNSQIRYSDSSEVVVRERKENLSFFEYIVNEEKGEPEQAQFYSEIINTLLTTEFPQHPLDLEGLLQKASNPDSRIHKYKENIEQSLNARRLFEGKKIGEQNFSVPYFKSLVEVRGFDLDLQKRIDDLAKTFPKNEQLQEIKAFLESVVKTFEDNFTLLIPHLPNVTPDFIWQNTKDENGQNGIKEFPKGLSAPAYIFREGGQASNFNNNALKRFFTPRVIKNEQGEVIETVDNSPLNLIAELLKEKDGVKKLEEAFLKCQIAQLFKMQEFVDKDFKYLPLIKDLKENFLTALEGAQEKIAQAQEKRECLLEELGEKGFSITNKEPDTAGDLEKQNHAFKLYLSHKEKHPGLSCGEIVRQVDKSITLYEKRSRIFPNHFGYDELKDITEFDSLSSLRKENKRLMIQKKDETGKSEIPKTIVEKAAAENPKGKTKENEIGN